MSQIILRLVACIKLYLTDYSLEAVMMTESQLQDFSTRLKKRFFELREEISLELLRSDDQHFIDLAGQVHDLEEESVANLLVDIDLAIIDMHVEEIREIDKSLIRIATGDYGVCVDCQGEIDVERLQVYLTAKRCTPCQAGYEHGHVGQHIRTI
jgi:RNA polymerase-binding transcription factor DksA